MSVSNLDSLRHSPEVVVTFVKRLIDDWRPDSESERRTQAREPIVMPVVVQPLDSIFQPMGEIFDAMTKDISTGGIGVVHSEPVAAKYLEITIATKDGEEMSLLAQVKHCTARAQCHHIGARFVVDWSSWRDPASEKRR